MNNKTKKDRFIKWIAIISLTTLIISLIPLLTVSFYNHPAADDYNYGIYTMEVLKNEGLTGVGKGLINTVKLFYSTWQGTYSAIILMSLQPSIWGNNFYFLGTFILLFFFLLGNYLLLKELIYNKLNLSKSNLIIVFALLSFITIETLPSLTQGFFWWNGSCYYTLFYSLFLIELALILKYSRKNSKILYFIICFLIVFIAGGNYVTALQQIIVLFFLNLYLLLKDKNKKGIPLLFLAILGLFISAIAPGNAYRAAVLEGYGIIKGIIYSFLSALSHLYKWNSLIGNIFIIAIIIILYQSYDKNETNFKYPIIFSTLTFCIFSAQFTPSLFAQGTVGEGRLLNIIYYSYYWFMILNIYYWLGWIRCKLKTEKILTKNSYKNLLPMIRKYRLSTMLFLIITACVIGLYTKEDYSTYKAYKILKDGSAKQYSEEYKARIKILESETKNVVLKEFSVKPEPLFYSEITTDPKHWLNVPIKEIYNKESVVLENNTDN